MAQLGPLPLLGGPFVHMVGVEVVDRDFRRIDKAPVRLAGGRLAGVATDGREGLAASLRIFDRFQGAAGLEEGLLVAA
ncbi:MAG TPA: hypothetical protein VEW26_03055, partial [Allosphingosinicella sp.]|nr:hypothetical protein [Allosphingosinicella sp.]